MTKKLAVFTLTALVAFGACKKKEEAKPAEPSAASGEKPAPAKVTLQLNWTPEPEFGGFYAGVHRGIYKDAGLDVTIKAGAAGIQTWKMVATGEVPYGIAESGEILRGNLKDAKLVALYAVYQTSPQGIMVHRDSGVTTLTEVFKSGKIKKVAVESGLPYVKFLEKKVGFGNVEMLQHGGNLSLFLADKTMAQQCFVFAEPVSAKEKGVDVVAFSTAEAGFNPYLAVVITRADYLASHRTEVEAFVKATRAGWEAYLKDPVPTNEYMRTQGGAMSMEAMKIAADLQQPYVTGPPEANLTLGQMDPARWKDLAEQLKDLGELSAIPDLKKLLP